MIRYYMSGSARSFPAYQVKDGLVQLAYGQWQIDGTRYVVDDGAIIGNWDTWRAWSDVCGDDWTPRPNVETWAAWQAVA